MTTTDTDSRHDIVAFLCQELRAERQARAELQQQLWELSKGADAAAGPSLIQTSSAAAGLQQNAAYTADAADIHTYSQPVSPATVLAGYERLTEFECTGTVQEHSQHQPQQHPQHQQPNMPLIHQQQHDHLLQQPLQELQGPTYSTLSPSPPRTVYTPSIHNARNPTTFATAARVACRCPQTTSSFCSSSWSDASSCCHQSNCYAGVGVVGAVGAVQHFDVPCTRPCGPPVASTAATLLQQQQQQQYVQNHNSYVGMPPRIHGPAPSSATATPPGPQAAPPSQPRMLFPEHQRTTQIPGQFTTTRYTAAAEPSGHVAVIGTAAAPLHAADPTAAAVSMPAAAQQAATYPQSAALPAVHQLAYMQPQYPATVNTGRTAAAAAQPAPQQQPQYPAAVNTGRTAAAAVQATPQQAPAPAAAGLQASNTCKSSAFSALSQSCSSEASLQLLLDAAAARQHNGLQLLAESQLSSGSSSCESELDTPAALAQGSSTTTANTSAAGSGCVAPSSSTCTADTTIVGASTAWMQGTAAGCGWAAQGSSTTTADTTTVGRGWVAPGNGTSTINITAVGASTAWMGSTKVFGGSRDPAAAYGGNGPSAYAAAAAVPGVISSAGGSSHSPQAVHDSVHAWSAPLQEHAVSTGTQVHRNRAALHHAAVSLADASAGASRTAATQGTWLGAAVGADPAALTEVLLEAEFLNELSSAQLTVLKEERDLLAEQHKSLLQLLADSSVTQQPGS